jgi:PD-(D/E)XK nuclease superfamily
MATTLPLSHVNLPRPVRSEFWLSQIKKWLECPKAYELRYVRRHPTEPAASRVLAFSNALHAVCADAFRELRDGRSCPVNLVERARSELLRQSYPPDLLPSLDADAAAIAAAVRWVFGRLPEDVEVLVVEEPLVYRHPASAVRPAFALKAKPDLVVRHPDGEVEIVDYKCGRLRRDPLQEVGLRVVVGATFGSADTVVRTTTAFTSSEELISEVLTRDGCRDVWRQVLAAVDGIRAGRFGPTPGSACTWCDFCCNGCDVCPVVTPPTEAVWLDEWLGDGTTGPGH